MKRDETGWTFYPPTRDGGGINHVNRPNSHSDCDETESGVHISGMRIVTPPAQGMSDGLAMFLAAMGTLALFIGCLGIATCAIHHFTKSEQTNGR